VAGVVGVANDIEVRLPSLDQRQIQKSPGTRFADQAPTSPVADAAKVTGAAKDGSPSKAKSNWISRVGADVAVRRIKGIKRALQIRSRYAARPAGRDQGPNEEDFRRGAEIDANRITVEALRVR